MRLDEEWRIIPGHLNYMVSDMGRVKLLVPIATRKPGLINISTGKTGYQQVYVDKRSWAVHILVMLAFVGERSEGIEVNHKNGVKDDNRLENLEYVTHLENIRHSFKMGLRPSSGKGQDHYSAKLTDDDIRKIRTLGDTMSQAAIGRMFNVTGTTIWSILHNRSWTHVK